jgi:hypothetical protein
MARDLHEHRDMTTTTTVVLKGLFSDALSCTRCGSDNVFPAPGPFGALGALIGIERHLCRPCGRSFWAKANAEYAGAQEPESESLGALLPEADEPPVLDYDVAHPEPEPVDLAALDAEFARRCAAAEHPERAERPGRRRRRRRRAVAAKA